MGKLDLGAVTIDDIANRDPRVRTAPVLTSPRSIRACLEHGVEPAMLVPKRVSDFADPGLDPELQRHKWEHHEQIRLERVDVLNAARRAMPPAPAEEATRVPGVAGATILGGATPSASPVTTARRPSTSASPVTTARRPSTARGVRPRSAAKVLNASVPGVRQSVSAVKEERRRLDAARRRNERTLAVMTESRAVAERRRAVNEAKVERTRRLVAEREKEKARLDKKHRDEVFEKIQRRKEEAKALERAKKKAMEERFRANQEARRLRREREEAERRACAEAAEKHQERLGEFKRRTDAIFAEQQRKIRAKERAMEEKESARRAAKEQEARELAAHAEERRRKAEERLRSARRNSEAFLEERRRHILDKAEHAEARREKLAERNDAAIREKHAKIIAKEEHRRERYREAREAEHAKCEALLRKKEEEDRQSALAHERRRRELAMTSLQRQLAIEERREKVECQRRYEEYQNAKLMEKIERDTERAKALNAAKDELRQARRENNMLLSMEREAILRADAREIRKSVSRPGTARPSAVARRYRPASARGSSESGSVPVTPVDFPGFRTPGRQVVVSKFPK